MYRYTENLHFITYSENFKNYWIGFLFNVFSDILNLLIDMEHKELDD